MINVKLISQFGMLYEMDQGCLAMISVHVQSGSDTLHSFLPDDSTYMTVLFLQSTLWRKRGKANSIVKNFPCTCKGK